MATDNSRLLYDAPSSDEEEEDAVEVSSYGSRSQPAATKSSRSYFDINFQRSSPALNTNAGDRHMDTPVGGVNPHDKVFDDDEIPEAARVSAKDEPKQSSITTMRRGVPHTLPSNSSFSIWNTMIGSSLLSMPYAINEAGWVLGIFIMLLMCAICLYCCLLILEHDQGNGINGKVVEFAALARQYLGPWGSWLCMIASVGIFWGASLAYCILMSGFLYNVGDTIAYWINGVGIIDTPIAPYWTTEFVAIVIMLLVFPLTLVKNFAFFARFTSVGTVSVVYIMGFTIYWAAYKGLRVTEDTLAANGKFYYFSGILTLSFFIHNAVLNILRNQKNPQHNRRDLSIAYILVLFSYMLVGLLYYFTAPSKAAIADNFLTDIQRQEPGNAGLFVAQFLLLFQMITVYPLLTYIIRFQFMDFFFANPYPSFLHVLALNMLIVFTCILMAVYYPAVSVVLRYTGAIFGLVAVYILPTGFHLVDQKRNNKLTRTSVIVHGSIVAFGVANLLAQFF